MNVKEFARLAMDAKNGTVSGNFSKDETMNVLYQALVEANHGKKYLDPRDARDGKCSDLFALIEETLDTAKVDTMTKDPFFVKFVDYRNKKLGDKDEFYIPDGTPFVVSDISSGTQSLRRQRMFGGETYTVHTRPKGLEIYEELDLSLSGRIDFVSFIEKMSDAFRNRTLTDIHTAWTTAVVGLEAPFAKTGTYSEDEMLKIVQHVKASNDAYSCYLMGTMLGLSKVTSVHDVAIVAQEDAYRTGIIGMFNGTPKIEAHQIHKAGSTDFLLADNVIDILPNGIKPIMYVTEGDSLILPTSSPDNVDLTQEHLVIEKIGVAARVPSGKGMFGRYTISA